MKKTVKKLMFVLYIAVFLLKPFKLALKYRNSLEQQFIRCCRHKREVLSQETINTSKRNSYLLTVLFRFLRRLHFNPAIVEVHQNVQQEYYMNYSIEDTI